MPSGFAKTVIATMRPIACLLIGGSTKKVKEDVNYRSPDMVLAQAAQKYSARL